MTPFVDLDGQVRSADPDRWLSSRFVGDRQSRADLITLYALEAELLAIPTRVTQPLLAEMRFAWWREQVQGGVFAGVARKGHPVLEALTDLVARKAVDRAMIEGLINAHIDRVHGHPHDLDAFYVGPMQAAVRILAGPGHDAAVVDAGRLWGLAQTGRLDEAAASRRAANRALKALPAAAFPGVAHATLIGIGQADPTRALRLTWAVARGRV